MAGMRQVWMSLADAETAGIDLSYVLAAIGPRRPGTLYYGAYWGDMNQVVDVRVRVTGDVATWWEVSEYTVGQSRIRSHCTSWEYDRGNRVHHGPGDLRRVMSAT